MHNIIRIPACQIPVLVITLLRMLMHLQSAVKHLHLLRHSLPHHPQCGGGAAPNQDSHTCKQHKPASMLFPFCQ